MTALLNKKILLSLGIIAFAAALAVGATIAAFTASDDIAGNTISTATVSISAAGDNAGGFLVKPIVATDLVPGGVSTGQPFQAKIQNTSSVPMNLYMYLTAPTGVSCPKTKLAWQSVDGNTLAPLFGYTSVPVLITDSNFAFLSTFDDISEKVQIGAAIPTGSFVYVRQKAGLDTTATNADIGSCVWTETFYGETI